MRIILAPDKFKGSLSAPQVAQSLKAGLLSVDPGLTIELMPVADGGEGTIDAVVASGFTRVTVTVQGPTGQPVAADFALRDKVGVIEMAQASGLDVLPGGEFAAMTASTYGTGELISAALDRGCTEIVLGVGGSATTDGGAGMISALGAKILDASGAQLSPGGGALKDTASVDLSGLDQRLAQVKFILASDVDNPLLGATGAAAIFAPQKGASPAQVEQLEEALTRYSQVITNTLGVAAIESSAVPGAGAAGGIGYAALAFLGAERHSGIEVILGLNNLAERLDGAGLIITGEGSLDEQSLFGKAPVGVATAAAVANVPVIAVCGRTTLSAETLRNAGIIDCLALVDIEPNPELSMKNAGSLLIGVGATVAKRLETYRTEVEQHRG